MKIKNEKWQHRKEDLAKTTTGDEERVSVSVIQRYRMIKKLTSNNA